MHSTLTYIHACGNTHTHTLPVPLSLNKRNQRLPCTLLNVNSAPNERVYSAHVWFVHSEGRGRGGGEGWEGVIASGAGGEQGQLRLTHMAQSYQQS
jgi:hypothetical protein